MWKKIQKFLPCRLQENPLLGPVENRAAALHKLTFICKNVLNGGPFFGFKASWLHASKISNHLELYTTQEKISK